MNNKKSIFPPFLIPYVIVSFIFSIFIDLFTKRFFKPRTVDENSIYRTIGERIVNLPPEDPMYQYYIRFVDKDDEYKELYTDKSDEYYNEWFKKWKSGQIIDSELRYAPNAYSFSHHYDKRLFNKSFIQYMKIQYNLHLNANIIQQKKFLKTIWRYYPEFTPRMDMMAYELNMYSDLIKERESRNKMKKLLESNDIKNEDIIEYLNSISSKKKYTKFLTKMLELKSKGYNEFTCFFGAFYNIDLPEVLKIHNNAVEDFERKGLPIPLELINRTFTGEIKPEMFKEIVLELGPENSSPFEEIVEKFQLRLKAKEPEIWIN